MGRFDQLTAEQRRQLGNSLAQHTADRILAMLDETPDTTLTEVAAALGMSREPIVKACTRLHRLGFVTLGKRGRVTRR